MGKWIFDPGLWSSAQTICNHGLKKPEKWRAGDIGFSTGAEIEPLRRV
jgi:hypothetical protein